MSSRDAMVDRIVREAMPRGLGKVIFEDRMSLRGELGIDSIGLMSLAFRLEEEFQIDLIRHAEQVANAQTVGDVRRLVRELGEGGAQ